MQNEVLDKFFNTLTGAKSHNLYKELLYLVIGIFFLFYIFFFKSSQIINLDFFTRLNNFEGGLIFLSVGYVVGRILLIIGNIATTLLYFLFAKNTKDFFSKYSQFIRTGWIIPNDKTYRELLERVTESEALEHIGNNPLLEDNFHRGKLRGIFTRLLIGLSLVYIFLISYWFLIPFFILLLLCTYEDMGNCIFNNEIMLTIKKREFKEKHDKLKNNL